MKIRLLTVAISILAFCSVASAATEYNVLEVNGHPGYLTATEVSPDGVMDKVLMLVSGYDSDNNDYPIDEIGDYQAVIDLLGADGWDVILFDYVAGDIDIKQNADNLARFIDYLDTICEPNYHLAVVAGSMGGIVTRCMFVQEYSGMGVETFVSVDAPHHGVYLSPWVESLAVLLIDTVAGHQMANGQSEFDTLYGWMRSVENNGTFKPTIIDPMATLAIALSDGEGEWEVDWGDLIIHTKYHPVCSFVEAEGLESDYMPYHSVCMFDNSSTDSDEHWGYNDYWYENTYTSYFDVKQPNPKTEHGAPEFAIQQAIDFAVANYSEPVLDTVAPVLTLVGDAVVYVKRRRPYVELGATVYDEGDPGVQVVIGGDVVDTTTIGTYVVTYDATDASGNQAIQLTRTVHVVKKL
jgi:surface protein with Ig-like domain